DEIFEIFPRLRERRPQMASTLSGGERQMLAIGRALMARPRLLMLDEPSLGLAPLVVREVLRVVSQLRSHGVSVLLVEQNVGMALDLAERAAVLEEGRIVALGRPEELMARPELRRAYLGLDAEGGATPGATAHGARAAAAPATTAARH
ncbi:ATP-binding cassette domain-containing protein, partial [Variovorax sp. RHLX14]|uniref:ATP-binding cassette domain-containing protein n=1 Tax=Variovorax sp. RHLX14 TaxID=1259731 RepID=UPI003F473FDE